MDIEEALKNADEWTEGHTFYEGQGGWRIAIATLAAEVRRLDAVLMKISNYKVRVPEHWADLQIDVQRLMDMATEGRRKRGK